MSLIDTRPGYFSPRTDLSSRQNPNKSLSGLLFHLLGEEVSGQSFAKYLASLSPEQHQLLETKTGGHLPQFRSLARETKSDMFARELLQLGLLLQGDGHGELAGRIYHSLGGGDEAFAGIGDAALREQARQCLEHLKRGSLGSGMEATFRSVVHGSTDLPAVLTMGALGPVFRLTRAVTFARLAGAETVTLFTQGVGLRAAAYLSGFMAESLAYTASNEIAGAVSGNAPDSNLSFFGKWAGGALMLGGLKAVPALLGLGASWAGSASIGGRLAQMAAPSVGQVSGMLLGNGLQAVAGLRELGSGAAEITDAVTGVLHCYVGGRLVGGRFGFMEAMEKGVELQVAQLEAPRLPKISPFGAFGGDLAYAGAAPQSVSGGESPRSPRESRGFGVFMSVLEGEDSDALESGVEGSPSVGTMGSPRIANRRTRRPSRFGESRPSQEASPQGPDSPRISRVSTALGKLSEASGQLRQISQAISKTPAKDKVRTNLDVIHFELSQFTYEEFRVFASLIERNMELLFENEEHGWGVVRRSLLERSPNSRSPEDIKIRPQLAERVATDYLAHENEKLRKAAAGIVKEAIPKMNGEELRVFQRMFEQFPPNEDNIIFRILIIATNLKRLPQPIKDLQIRPKLVEQIVNDYYDHPEAAWRKEALDILKEAITEMDHKELLVFERILEQSGKSKSELEIFRTMVAEAKRIRKPNRGSSPPPPDKKVDQPSAPQEVRLTPRERGVLATFVEAEAAARDEWKGKGSRPEDRVTGREIARRAAKIDHGNDEGEPPEKAFETYASKLLPVRELLQSSPVVRQSGNNKVGKEESMTAAVIEAYRRMDDADEGPITPTEFASRASVVYHEDGANQNLGIGSFIGFILTPPKDSQVAKLLKTWPRVQGLKKQGLPPSK